MLTTNLKRAALGLMLAAATGLTAQAQVELQVEPQAEPQVELNIDASGGRPITICAPAAVSPFSSALRDVLTRLVIICDIQPLLLLGKLSEQHQ